MDETEPYMDVIIQKMVKSEYSFVIHTKDPSNGKDNIIIELVPGLGESLVSGKEKYQGSAFRFSYNKQTKAVTILSYCNKSFRIDMDGKSGTKDTRVDYTNDDLTLNWDKEEWQDLLKKLGKIAEQIEKKFNQHQDIEGAIEVTQEGHREIMLLQSRAQVVLRINSILNSADTVRTGL
mgnify:CR=1 FL=1